MTEPSVRRRQPQADAEAFAEYLGTIVEWLAEQGDSRLEECKRLLHRWNTFCHTQDDGAFYYVQHPDAIDDIDDEGCFTVSYDIEKRYTECDYVDGTAQRSEDSRCNIRMDSIEGRFLR